MHHDLLLPLSAPPDSSSSSRIFPPSTSFLGVLFFFLLLHKPASSPFPVHLHASHAQRTSTFVLLLSVPVSNSLLDDQFLVESTRLFFSRSTRPSASFSRSTFHMRQFSFPLPLSLSMFHIHIAPLGGSLLLQVLFLSSDSHVYPSISSPFLALPSFQVLSFFVFLYHSLPPLLSWPPKMRSLSPPLSPHHPPQSSSSSPSS